MPETAQVTVELIPVFIYIIILMIISFLGNGITCFVFGYKLRQTVTRNFIFSLALMDLISSMIVMSSEIYFLLTLTSFNHPELCKFFRFITYLSHSTTSLILLAVAFDRFNKVCRPFSLYFNVRRSRIYCVCCILISMCTAWPSVLLYGTKTLPDHAGTTCSVNDDMEKTAWPFVFYTAYFLGFAFLAISMVVLYVFVIKEIKNLRKSQDIRRSRERVSLMPHKKMELVEKVPNASVSKDEKRGQRKLSKGEINTDDKNQKRKSTEIQKSETETRRPSKQLDVPSDTLDREKQKHSRPNSYTGAIPKIHVEDFGSETKVTKKTIPSVPIGNRFLEALKQEEISFESELTSGHGTLTDSEDERNEESEVDARAALKRVFSIRKQPAEPPKVQTRPSIRRQISTLRSIYQPGKTTRMLLTVTLCFVLSFLPFFIVVLIRSHMRDMFYISLTPVQTVMSSIFIRSYLVSNAVNPIIYGILNAHFRKEVKTLFKGKVAKSYSTRKRATLKTSNYE